MSNVAKFEFKKTYKEIEINGELHRVDFNDDAINRYMELTVEAREKFKSLEQQDVENATKAQLRRVQDDQREACKKFIEGFLGDGKFDHFYEMSGRSVLNLMSLVSFLRDLLEQELLDKTDAKKKDYLKKK